MLTVVTTAIWYTGTLLREPILRLLITRKMFFSFYCIYIEIMDVN